MMRTRHGQWWPDGLDLGPFMPRLFPQSGDPWSHAGNQFNQYPSEAPLPDFPAFALNVPIVSPRAADVLRRAALISDAVPLTVSGAPHFAIQPQRSQNVFRPASSSGLTLPGGEIFHYHRRDFETAGPEFEPFSELYITERVLDQADAAGLTGLEYYGLVFDDGPVEPVYPTVEQTAIPDLTVRRQLEYDLLYWRCSLWSYSKPQIEEAVKSAVARGVLSFDYVVPEYQRVSVTAPGKFVELR